MTLFCLPFAYDYLAAGCDVAAIRTDSDLALLGNRLFQAYLVADLAMGLVHYRKQVNLLSGWVHHALYVFVIDLAIRQGWTHVFSFAATMEVRAFAFSIC